MCVWLDGSLLSTVVMYSVHLCVWLDGSLLNTVVMYSVHSCVWLYNVHLCVWLDVSLPRSGKRARRTCHVKRSALSCRR